MKPESRDYNHRTSISVPYECKEILDALGYEYIETLTNRDSTARIAVWFWDQSYMLIYNDIDYRDIPTEHLEALVQILDEDARHYYMRSFNLGVYSDAYDEYLRTSKQP